MIPLIIFGLGGLFAGSIAATKAAAPENLVVQPSQSIFDNFVPSTKTVVALALLGTAAYVVYKKKLL